MSTSKFTNIGPNDLSNLSRNYPFFLMIIMLIPFYYLTSKIAAEKESKAKEGMKMMGLTDDVYYWSLFLFYSSISLVTSLLVSLVSSFQIFKNNSFFVIFAFNVLYSTSLFGVALIIVAFLPNKRSSSVAATLFHIISYYASLSVWDPSASTAIQYGLSLLPNICMNQCVKQFFIYNINVYGGATFSNLLYVFQNYSLGIGMAIMAVDCLLYILLGLWLDQIVPSEYGVAKPWNFCCRRSDRRQMDRVDVGDNQNLLDGDQEANEEESGPNFEPLPDSIRR